MQLEHPLSSREKPPRSGRKKSRTVGVVTAALATMFALALGAAPGLVPARVANAEELLAADYIWTWMELASEGVYANETVPVTATLRPTDGSLAQGTVEFSMGDARLTVPVISNTATAVFPAGMYPAPERGVVFTVPVVARFYPSANTRYEQIGVSDYVQYYPVHYSTVELSVPGEPVLHQPTTIVARIRPATAGGTVYFIVDYDEGGGGGDDDSAGQIAPVVNGVATVEYVFTRSGEHNIYVQYNDPVGSGGTDEIDFEVKEPGGLFNPGGPGSGSSGVPTVVLGSLGSLLGADPDQLDLDRTEPMGAS